MRGLDEVFIKDLQVGVLKGFLESVKKDDTLCLEIRENYINIYYRGGNLFKISPSKTKEEGYTIFFDLKYCLKNTHLVSASAHWKIADWIEQIPYLKAEMDWWFAHHPKSEREFQQLVVRENNFSGIANDTDYYIVDTEYADSDNKSRFDMLAIKWPSTSASRRAANQIGLVFIEKKYGDGAMAGSAGIVKHFDDLNSFLPNTQKNDRINKIDRIYKETETIFNQKINLGLFPGLSKNIKISTSIKPEFILLVANHKPVKTAWQRELKEVKNQSYYHELTKKIDIKIARSSFMGYGLYESQMQGLENFLINMERTDNYPRGKSFKELEKTHKASEEYQKLYENNHFMNEKVNNGLSINIKQHPHIESPASSAAACLNVLGYLNQNPEDIIPFFHALGLKIDHVIPFPAGADLDGETYDDHGPIVFEWIGPKKSPLNESGSRGQYRTSVDAFMFAEIDGEVTQFLIEWKFTEKYTSRNQFAKFAGGRGIERYRRYSDVLAVMRRGSFPFKFQDEGGLGLSDFSYEPFYQLMRITLLARMTTPLVVGTVAASKYKVLHLSHSQNDELNVLKAEQLQYSPGLMDQSGKELHDVWCNILVSEEETKNHLTGYWDRALKALSANKDSDYLRERYG